MTLAHVMPAVTLEAERDAIDQHDVTLNGQRREQAGRVYLLHLRWQRLYPAASLREYVTWLGHGVYQSRRYTYYYAGHALLNGFAGDPDQRLGELDQIGRALLDGDSTADIRARLNAGGKVRRAQTSTVSIQIPAGQAPAIRAARDAVSESDNLNGPEAVARVVLSYANAPEIIRDGLRGSDSTGAALIPALVDAVEVRRDYRSALKQQGCVICGVRADIELHHAKTEPGDRFRTHERLLPLCKRHHGARPGDSADSIHAYSYEALADNAQFWRRAFIAVSDAAEATRPSASQVPVEDLEGES